MKSVGQILKKERQKQGKTLNQIHRETKIPEKNLIALETDDYASLPPATFIKGFIQIYAKSLDLDEKKLIAIFRRDWQKKEQTKIIPEGLTKPLDGQSSFWSPKTAMVLIISLFLIVFLSYLGFQLKKYFSPPSLTVERPLENEKVKEQTVEIKGRANQDASVYINDELININESGNFSYELKLFPGENTIYIKAINRRGKETSISRKVKLVDKNP